MKRILLIVITSMLPILASADGREQMEHSISLFHKGQYEFAMQQFRICCYFADIDKVEVEAWIKKCEEKLKAIRIAKEREAAENRARAQEAEAARIALIEKERADSLRLVNRFIYVSSDALTPLGEKSELDSAVRKGIKAANQKCTSNQHEALWTICVSATYSKNMSAALDGMKYLYGYASILVTNDMTGEIIYENDAIKVKGYGKSDELAVENTYTKLNNEISKFIKQNINDILNIK